jgi:hypothetical protein
MVFPFPSSPLAVVSTLSRCREPSHCVVAQNPSGLHKRAKSPVLKMSSSIATARLSPVPVTEKEMEEGRVGASSSDIDASKAAEQTLDYECEEKDELVRKWREGRHLVIEHHSKEPGTEVGQILVSLPYHLTIPARCKLRSFITPLTKDPFQISKTRLIDSQRHHSPSEMKSSSTCTPSLEPRPTTWLSNRLRS